MSAKKKAPKITAIIKRGQDYVLTLTFRDGKGNLVDVSARTFTGKIATAYGAATTSMTVGMGSASVGVVTFSIARATTSGLALGDWIGEVWQTVAGSKTPVLEMAYTVEDTIG
jgi:hypothetical protein